MPAPLIVFENAKALVGVNWYRYCVADFVVHLSWMPGCFKCPCQKPIVILVSRDDILVINSQRVGGC